MGPHESRIVEATAEPPAGEHSEAWEPASSRGRPCPGRCGGGRTAGGRPRRAGRAQLAAPEPPAPAGLRTAAGRSRTRRGLSWRWSFPFRPSEEEDRRHPWRTLRRNGRPFLLLMPRRLVLVGFGNYVTSDPKRTLLAGEPEPGRCMLEVTWDRWRDGAEPRWPRSSNSPGYRSPWPPHAWAAVTLASDPEVRLRLRPTLRSAGD